MIPDIFGLEKVMSSSLCHYSVSAAAESSAPLRVDLAGGWTDVPPYPTDFGGEGYFAEVFIKFANIEYDMMV